MFAVVANGIQTICKTQRQLDSIIAIYPYPKFKKCKTTEEAREWLRRNSRSIKTILHNKYGDTAISGYATIEYSIEESYIQYSIRTDKVGFIRIRPSEDVKIESRLESLNVQVCNIKLDNSLIPHHTIAIRRILKLLGEFIDVDIVVPDISIYLAMTKYSGKNYVIRNLQKDIINRLGGVSITVK